MGMEMLRLAGATTPPGGNVSLKLSAKECAKYSLARALAGFYEAHNARALTSGYEESAPASFERELTQECWQRMGRPGTAWADTVIVPYEVAWQRDVSVAASGGGYLVESKIPMLTDAQRPRGIVRRAGATYLTGLRANQSVPRWNATATGQWLTSETTATTESTPAVVSVPLTPRTFSVYVERSRLLWLLAPELSEMGIRRDLMRIADGALDIAALSGDGTAAPQGIVSTPGVGTFNGGSVTWANVLEAQTDVLNANATVNPAAFAYVTTPTVANVLATRQGFSTLEPIWRGPLDTGTCAGAPAFSSTNVPSGTIVAGDWSQLVVAEYGPGVEIRINPAANFAAGIVGFCLDYTVDCAATFPSAFSVASSVT